jgi:hypothetical protein
MTEALGIIGVLLILGVAVCTLPVLIWALVAKES